MDKLYMSYPHIYNKNTCTFSNTCYIKRVKKIRNKNMTYTNDLATEVNTGQDTSFTDFEDFLQEQFMQDEPESVGTKDDFQDNFDNWLQSLDAQEWLDYGNKFNRLNK